MCVCVCVLCTLTQFVGYFYYRFSYAFLFWPFIAAMNPAHSHGLSICHKRINAIQFALFAQQLQQQQGQQPNTHTHTHNNVGGVICVRSIAKNQVNVLTSVHFYVSKQTHTLTHTYTRTYAKNSMMSSLQCP